MAHSYEDPVPQGEEPENQLHVYVEGQLRGSKGYPRQLNERQPYVEMRGNPKSPSLIQQSRQHLDEHLLLELGSRILQHHEECSFGIKTLEQQQKQYYSAEAIQQLRLRDVELKRSRLLERFQLYRILRSKEAAAQVEALNRRLQQHDAEAAWRTQRNSYMRDEAFQILHWKLTKKDISDAVARLRTEQNKFEKQVMRFCKANAPGRASRPQSLFGASGWGRRESPNYVSDCTCGLSNLASGESSCTVRLERNGSSTSIVEKFTATISDEGCPIGDKNVRQDTFLPATAQAGAAQAETRHSRPSASGSKPSDPPREGGRNEDSVAVCHARAERGPTYKRAGTAQSPSTKLSPRIVPRRSSPELKSMNCLGDPAHLLANSDEPLPTSTEPLRLQLLELRYKQDMAALELQKVVHRPAPPLLRRQEGCDTSADRIELESGARLRSGAAAQATTFSAAQAQVCSEDEKHKACSPPEEGSTSSKAYQQVSPPYVPPQSFLAAASGSLATTDGRAVSATSKVFPKQVAVDYVRGSSVSQGADALVGTPVEEEPVTVDMHSAPISTPARPSTSLCAHEQQNSSAPCSSANQNALSNTNDRSLAAKYARATRSESPTERRPTHNNTVDKAAGLLENKNSAETWGTHSPENSSPEPVPAAPEAEEQPSPTVPGSHGGLQQGALTPPSNTTAENHDCSDWQAPVVEDARYLWMSPDVPSENPIL